MMEGYDFIMIPSKPTRDIDTPAFMSAILSFPGFGHVRLKRLIDDEVQRIGEFQHESVTERIEDPRHSKGEQREQGIQQKQNSHQIEATDTKKRSQQNKPSGQETTQEGVVTQEGVTTRQGVVTRQSETPRQGVVTRKGEVTRQSETTRESIVTSNSVKMQFNESSLYSETSPYRFDLDRLIFKFCTENGISEQVFRRKMRDFESTFISGDIIPVMCWSKLFPQGFLGLRDAPQVIFISGDPSILSCSNITIVGTRKHTFYGGKVVRRIIDSIKNIATESAVVSGLAYGIDSQAHQYTLDSGLRTIAVVAGGIDKGYPKRNERLYDEIVQKGAVLSEFPPGVDVVKGMFPMRNRLLAALSKMVIVVESSSKGGSMITARHAAEMGVDVLAVPGDIDRSVAEGCNLLIAQGAIPLYSFEVFDEYLELKRGAC